MSVVFRAAVFILAFLGPLCGALQGEKVTVYFSPDDQLDKRLIAMIEREKKSILAAVYCFTNRSVAAALASAQTRGVKVELIVDRFSVKIKAPLAQLIDAGVSVHVWDPDRGHRKKAHRSLMHNKFCVFGDDTVWTGSFNWTYEASKMHEENVVVFTDPYVAQAYRNQFQTIQMKSCVPLASYVARHPMKKTVARR